MLSIQLKIGVSSSLSIEPVRSTLFIVSAISFVILTDCSATTVLGPQHSSTLHAVLADILTNVPLAMVSNFFLLVSTKVLATPVMSHVLFILLVSLSMSSVIYLLGASANKLISLQPVSSRLSLHLVPCKVHVSISSPFDHF